MQSTEVPLSVNSTKVILINSLEILRNILFVEHARKAVQIKNASVEETERSNYFIELDDFLLNLETIYLMACVSGYFELATSYSKSATYLPPYQQHQSKWHELQIDLQHLEAKYPRYIRQIRGERFLPAGMLLSNCLTLLNILIEKRIAQLEMDMVNECLNDEAIEDILDRRINKTTLGKSINYKQFRIIATTPIQHKNVHFMYSQASYAWFRALTNTLVHYFFNRITEVHARIKSGRTSHSVIDDFLADITDDELYSGKEHRLTIIELLSKQIIRQFIAINFNRLTNTSTRNQQDGSLSEAVLLEIEALVNKQSDV